MDFQSILYADTDPVMVQSEPGYFQDLHLDYLLNIIERSVKDYAVHPHYYTLPSSFEVIRYRQDIFQDLTRPALYDCVRRFCLQMQKSRHARKLADESREEIQAASYHLEAAAFYWDGLMRLGQELAACELTSEGFLSFREYVDRYIAEWQEKGFDKELARASEFFAKIRFRLVVGRERLTIEEISDEDEETGNSATEENYFRELAELLSLKPEETKDYMEGLFPNALEPSYLELTLIQMLRKNNPEIFREIRRFYQTYPDFYSDKLLRFEEEVQFYISFLEFSKKTEELGYSLNVPDISGDNGFAGRGVYDLALVWKNANRDYTIVSNDFCFPENPAFFVVTGPNQGGKTTFARSMAQAVYLARMGLYVNAASFSLPWFDGIATHFEMEERIQSNSGKLKDEIDRLAPMMHQDKKSQFIVLNELFTTATTHDALIMGKKVMLHFLQKQCYGIYVTHIQELAEESDSIISMVAQIEPGEDNRRTYRMLPMLAQGYGYSDSLVKQFELRYEDLIRRLT